MKTKKEIILRINDIDTGIVGCIVNIRYAKSYPPATKDGIIAGIENTKQRLYDEREILEWVLRA